MPLKHPEYTYPLRLQQFLDLLGEVQALSPSREQLWQVMDGMAFEDTETALQTALYNQQVQMSHAAAACSLNAVTD